MLAAGMALSACSSTPPSPAGLQSPSDDAGVEVVTPSEEVHGAGSVSDAPPSTADADGEVVENEVLTVDLGPVHTSKELLGVDYSGWEVGMTATFHQANVDVPFTDLPEACQANNIQLEQPEDRVYSVVGVRFESDWAQSSGLDAPSTLQVSASVTSSGSGPGPGSTTTWYSCPLEGAIPQLDAGSWEIYGPASLDPASPSATMWAVSASSTPTPNEPAPSSPSVETLEARFRGVTVYGGAEGLTSLECDWEECNVPYTP